MLQPGLGSTRRSVNVKARLYVGTVLFSVGRASDGVYVDLRDFFEQCLR